MLHLTTLILAHCTHHSGVLSFRHSDATFNHVLTTIPLQIVLSLEPAALHGVLSQNTGAAGTSHHRQSRTKPHFVPKARVDAIISNVGSPEDPSKARSFRVLVISLPQTRTTSEVLQRKGRPVDNVKELAQYHLCTDVTSQKTLPSAWAYLIESPRSSLQSCCSCVLTKCSLRCPMRNPPSCLQSLAMCLGKRDLK